MRLSVSELFRLRRPGRPKAFNRGHPTAGRIEIVTDWPSSELSNTRGEAVEVLAPANLPPIAHVLANVATTLNSP
jgi:hypothetical protein